MTWAEKYFRVIHCNPRANDLLITALPITIVRKIADRKQLKFALDENLAIFFSGHLSTPEEAS